MRSQKKIKLFEPSKRWNHAALECTLLNQEKGPTSCTLELTLSMDFNYYFVGQIQKQIFLFLYFYIHMLGDHSYRL